MLLVLLTAAALAAPTYPALTHPEIEEAWQALDQLQVGELAHDAAGLSFTVGQVDYHLDSGELYPIAPAAAEDAWAGALGFVWVGPGQLTTTFADRAQAQAFANHQVRILNVDLAAARPVADQGA